MTKKIGIITIDDGNNYGNRLQNYASQEIIKKILPDSEVYTLKNNPFSNTKDKFIIRWLKNLKKKSNYSSNVNRANSFIKFNENIKFYKNTITIFSNLNEFDYVLVGSDQVWNANISRLRELDLLANVKPERRIALSASFGIDYIPNKIQKEVRKELNKFKAISVREEKGKELVNELTGREDVEVLIDPTLMLTADEWNNVAKKPACLKDKKYILNYFLGKLSDDRRKEIERVAEENDCEIINILDPQSPFYECGPSEFLYLEENAFLICTDSFHSSVFAFVYNRPFIIFEREGSKMNMNSRLETLIKKFQLKNRKYNGKITKDNINHDYSHSYRILELEKTKYYEFLKNAFSKK